MSRIAPDRSWKLPLFAPQRRGSIDTRRAAGGQNASGRDDDHHEHNREWLHGHFSVIFSDFYLFNRLLGRNTADLDTRAQAYLRQLEIEDKLHVSHGALSTTALSQGTAQTSGTPYGLP